MILAADDVRDPGVEVVDGDREVVEGAAVGARDHRVVQRARSANARLAADEVVDDRRALVGDAQAHRALALVLAAEAAVVAVLAAF